MAARCDKPQAPQHAGRHHAFQARLLVLTLPGFRLFSSALETCNTRSLSATLAVDGCFCAAAWPAADIRRP